MNLPGNVMPADLDVDKIFEASRALDEARAELRQAHEFAARLTGGIVMLDRLDDAASTLTRIQALHAALVDATADLEQARLAVARARLEIDTQAWPPDPDARPMLARLRDAMPKLDRIDKLIGLLDRLELLARR